MFPGIAAVGIGALLGGLGAKQRGGNFLKGALTGAALGGVGGMLGAKFGAGTGPFGFGKSMMGWAGPMAAIGMGTEMMGQGEANRMRKLQQQQWLDEEEDRRIARLNKYAGYDVTDPKNFLTPQSYFGAARGGLASLPHYANGGWHDVPMEESGPTMDPEIMQLPMGQEGSFEEENEGILGLELAGLTDEEMSELQALQSLSIVTPEDHPQYESIQIRLQELRGKLKAADGGYINRPGYKDAGMVYDIDIDDEKYDFSMAQGGKVKRPGYKFGGGIDWSQVTKGPTGGFGGGPEKVWQAKTIANTDPGVYKQGDWWGTELTPGGKNVNQAVQDWQNWRKGRIGSSYSPSNAQHIYNENYLRNFEEKYPGVSGLGMTAEDVFNQQLLEEEAPEGYTFAQGGIADLDMRGGGHSIGPGTGTSDDVPAMLSDGEFVMTANAVRNLGGGDRMLGAQRMYNMMNSLDPNSQTPGEMNVVGYG